MPQEVQSSLSTFLKQNSTEELVKKQVPIQWNMPTCISQIYFEKTAMFSIVNYLILRNLLFIELFLD